MSLDSPSQRSTWAAMWSIAATSQRTISPTTLEFAPNNLEDKGLQVCCTLNRIAFNGGSTKAHFATNKEQLRAALHEILSKTGERQVELNLCSRTAEAVATRAPTHIDFSPRFNRQVLVFGKVCSNASDLNVRLTPSPKNSNQSPKKSNRAKETTSFRMSILVPVQSGPSIRY